MIFLFVGFLERVFNKGRGLEGYIIIVICIFKDIYEFCRFVVYYYGDYVDWFY